MTSQDVKRYRGPVHLAELPFRVVYLIVSLLDQPDTRARLAMVNREWARNIRLVRRSDRSTAVAFAFFESEKRYANLLELALQQRPTLEGIAQRRVSSMFSSPGHAIPAACCAPADVAVIFGNLSMLATLSMLLRNDLRVRVVGWKHSSSVADVFLLVSQAMRMFTLYGSNLEQARSTLRRCRASNPECATALGLAENFNPPLDTLLQSPVRVCLLISRAQLLAMQMARLSQYMRTIDAIARCTEQGMERNSESKRKA
jgi:hypothetical protein